MNMRHFINLIEQVTADVLSLKSDLKDDLIDIKQLEKTIAIAKKKKKAKSKRRNLLSYIKDNS